MGGLSAPVPARLWHGGAPGVPAGGLIVPGHSRDHNHPGCPICEARARGEGHELDPETVRRDRIYLTEDREYARYYASLYGHGDLYQVVPVGAIERSTEDGFPSWVAQSGLVVAVYARRVTLTASQRRRLYRRWAALEGVHPRDADREFERMIGDLMARGPAALAEEPA